MANENEKVMLSKEDLQAILDGMQEGDEMGYIGPDGRVVKLNKERLAALLADFPEGGMLQEDPADAALYEEGGEEAVQAAQPAQPGQPAGDQNEAQKFFASLEGADVKKLDKALKGLKADEVKRIYNSLPDQATKDQFATDLANMKLEVQKAKDFKGPSPAKKAVFDFTQKYSKYIPHLMAALTVGLATGVIPPDFGLGAAPVAGGAEAGIPGAAEGAVANGAHGGVPPIPEAPGMIPFDAAAAAADPQTWMQKFQQFAKDFGPAAALEWVAGKFGGGENGEGGMHEALFGKKFSNFTPEQQGIISKLGQLGIKGLENNQYNPEQIEGAARRNFTQKTIPSITERFSGSGGSSALGNQLREGGQDLEDRLAALKYEYGQNQQRHFTGLAGLGITPKFPNATIEAKDTHGILGGLSNKATEHAGQKLYDLLYPAPKPAGK